MSRTWSRSISSPCPPLGSASSSFSSCSPTTAGASSTQRHRASHRRLDLSAARRRVPGRFCAAVSSPRSRQCLRARVLSTPQGMGIVEVVTAPRSPWQNPFAERFIGSVRRECLDHVVVLTERHLRRILTAYFAYYHRARTHLSLDKDAPDGRPIERPELGNVIPIREVGGLHPRYVRRAA